MVIGTMGPGATWSGNTPMNVAAVDPDCAANIVMQEPGSPNPSALRADFTPATTIAAGATGTLFYRIRTPVAADGTTDHVIGLTDTLGITTFNFKSGLRNTVPAGTNNMDASDAGVYEQVEGNLADNTWYKEWMVTTNTNPGTFELYMQSETDPNYATQTKLSPTSGNIFAYRVDGDTDIINLLFHNANNPGGVAGNSLLFDDIYINPTASDLSDPSVPKPFWY